MVSVCMVTCNGEEFVREQIASILPQLGESDEIIVSDDASTDGTLSVVTAIDDPRIRIFCNRIRVGVVRNVEKALGHARGDMIFLSDQDDVWLSGKVAACSNALEKAVLVVHDAFYFEHGRITGRMFDGHRFPRNYMGNLIVNKFTGCCMAFRREVLDYLLPIPSSVPMHDSWIGLTASRKGQVCYLPEPLVLYRKHGGNTVLGKNRIPWSERIRHRISLWYYTGIR